MRQFPAPLQPLHSRLPKAPNSGCSRRTVRCGKWAWPTEMREIDDLSGAKLMAATLRAHGIDSEPLDTCCVLNNMRSAIRSVSGACAAWDFTARPRASTAGSNAAGARKAEGLRFVLLQTHQTQQRELAASTRAALPPPTLSAWR